MGSAAGKPAQGSAAFSTAFSQNIFPSPQSRSQTTSQSRQQSSPQGRQRSTPQDPKPTSRSSSTLSFLSQGEDSDDGMVCESCSANFTIFKRKNRCLECSKLFCANCMRKEPRKCCKTCHMFIGSKSRSQLMEIKVKDLRQYLAARDISTMACREKGELVDLVIQYLASHNNSAFMVTVNNLEDTPDSSSVPQASSQPEARQRDSGRTDPPAPAAEVSDSIPEERPEPMVVNIEGEIELGPARTAWPEGSSTSGSEVEHSPVTSFASPEEEQTTNTTTTPQQPQQAQGRRRTSISDLSKIDDIADLTVRQLKEILVLNFIDYKGCVERWELEERVRRLYTEREDFKIKEQASASANTDSNELKTATADFVEDNICKICMDSPIDCVLLECGHMVTCTKCGKKLAECPMCRQYIVRAVHVFRS